MFENKQTKRAIVTIKSIEGGLLNGILLYMIDRCGRIGMMMALCVCYPKYLFALQLLVLLEVAGGWSRYFQVTSRENGYNGNILPVRAQFISTNN